MVTAPPEDQRRLLEVQGLDTRLQQLVHQRRTHPSLATLAEFDTRIADLHGSLVDSRTAVSDLEREVAKAEADVEQVRVRAARDQQRLDSGAMSAKDSQAFVSELEALAKRQSVLEDVELEAMERLEAHQASLAKVEEAHAELTAGKAKAEAERDAAWAEIDTVGRQVKAKRASTAEGLDAGLLALYDRLRAQLGGLGAAALRGGRCEGCRLELNPGDLAAVRSAPPEQVVRCEECGRILVRVTDDAPAS
ncbi:C4-type zinc ribbon domain-containing protein [Isoptericola sp. NEAU-Y5]|uniref:C4-type zinc ribbon domain-containing protein n=1 Tax=Isoptericola luteus TaxID=2879484 RepID=A0ABS7ZKE2_9MICO|nr:C4-type zinc ribbon domain-containing protein [Isoptericola sp. NEAU-Y5]MCA5894972.1 C4-type zinc ribbon domain-containing protein [Isoptericola sp. NEAU-Y5]